MREIQITEQNNITTVERLENQYLDRGLGEDMYEEAASFLEDGISITVGRYQIFEPEDEYTKSEQTGSFVFADGRIGIEYGADGKWADVDSIEQGLHLYFNDPDEFDNRN